MVEAVKMSRLGKQKESPSQRHFLLLASQKSSNGREVDHVVEGQLQVCILERHRYKAETVV